MVSLAAVVSVLADSDMSVFRPATPGAESIRGLFVLVLAVAAFIFVLTEGALVYCTIRFRKQQADANEEPPQIYGSLPIELAWTVGPFLIVFVLFLVVIRVLMEVRPASDPPNVVRVTVVGHQWWWEYQYPELGVTTANEMHVPCGTDKEPRTIYLSLRSADVIHSFWVPRLGGKTDVIPGIINHAFFQVNKPDTYIGRCSEYCGTQHANMMIRVIAEPKEAFDKWVANEVKPAVKDESVRADREVFLGLGCVACHTVRGTSARGTFGPDLTHLMSRKTLAAGLLENTPVDLARWIHDPQRYKPGCKMPDLKLDEKTVKAVTAYLQTLE